VELPTSGFLAGNGAMMLRAVPRWKPIAVLAVAIALPAAAAHGAPPPPTPIQHDDARQIRSGFYPGDDGTGDPLADRAPGTFETFAFEVPAGTRHGSLTARIAWSDRRVNLDLYVYRVGADGRAQQPAVARSAATSSASEQAAYARPDGSPVEPGRYLVVVDNFCSRDADVNPRTGLPAACGIGPSPPADEDDFSGTIALANQLPAVTLLGPDAGNPQQPLTFTAAAEDLDGTIAGYWFDLDGNGTYEHDNDGSATAATVFEQLGTYSVGVQVIDDSGAVAVGSRLVTISEPPAPPARPRQPLLSFRVNRRTFGGPRERRLIVSYRLRERARVTVSLRRGGRFVRRIDAGVRQRRRTYRIALRPAHLRRGVYTVSIAVHSASGKQQVARLSSRRR
jgi:hypothetical protein